MNIIELDAIVMEALLTDGERHKQWYLSQIYKLIHKQALFENTGIDEGIAP